MASATTSLSRHPPPWRSQGLVQGLTARASAESAFVREIDRLLHALGVANVRLTLLAVAAPGVREDFLEDVARTAFASSGLVGALPDGSVGVLYVGPRPNGAGADRDVINEIARHIREALVARRPEDGERSFRLRVVHRWTDEVESAQDLISSLPRPPRRPGDPCEDYISTRTVASKSCREFSRSGAFNRRRPWQQLCLAAGFVATWLAAIWFFTGLAAARAAEAPSTLGAAAASTAISAIPRTGAGPGAAMPTDVMRGMDANDKARVADALARVSDGADVEWINSSTGIRYTIFLVKTEPLADGSVCRAFTVTAIAGEAVQQVYRMRCRRPVAKGVGSPVFDRPSPTTAEKGILP